MIYQSVPYQSYMPGVWCVRIIERIDHSCPLDSPLFSIPMVTHAVWRTNMPHSVERQIHTHTHTHTHRPNKVTTNRSNDISIDRLVLEGGNPICPMSIEDRSSAQSASNPTNWTDTYACLPIQKVTYYFLLLLLFVFKPPRLPLIDCLLV